MKRIAKYLQLFLAPWMAVLMLAMLSLLLSSHVTAQLVDAEQLFGLDSQFMVKVFGILFIVGIVLMLISMMVDGFFLVRQKYGARIQQFVSPVIAPLSGKLLSIRHRMTDR
ncbi:hypothetical protein ACJU26_05375 [Acidithiobacillus sp. M4-SHS-6]|uniref:hypothetical protein n=1 Tax=Acidithiobacillus sp. M4-SHS-6 TaxID=3383024 RepID=UPI0039BE86CE